MSSSSIDALLSIFERERAGLSFEESLSRIDHAEMWVRIAVGDEEVAYRLYQQCKDWLDTVESSPLQVGLAMHYIRSLGARHLLDSVATWLSTCIHSQESSQESSQGSSQESNQESSQGSSQDQDKSSCWFTTVNPLSQYTPEATPWREALEARERLRDGVSRFAHLAPLFSESSLGYTALSLIGDLSISGHPAMGRALAHVSAHLSASVGDRFYTETLSADDKLLLSAWLWDHLDLKADLTPLLPVAAECLNGRSDRAEVLAIRLALLSPESATLICQSLVSLELEQRQRFAMMLEKQLKRVGKIRLWVSCRELLLDRSKGQR